MARRKSKRGRKTKQKIPIFATAGTIGSGMVLYNTYKNGGADGAAKAAIGIGSSGGVETQVLKEVYTPVAIGMIGTMVASKLGINKHLAKVPFIGKQLRF